MFVYELILWSMIYSVGILAIIVTPIFGAALLFRAYIRYLISKSG